MRTSIALIALAVGLAVTLAASAGVRRAPPAFPRNFYAAWSPDGKRIAFASDRAGTKDIYVMSADGTHQRSHPARRMRMAQSTSSAYIS